MGHIRTVQSGAYSDCPVVPHIYRLLNINIPICTQIINDILIILRMVRNYVRKRNEPVVSEAKIRTAVLDVLQNKISIRIASTKHGVKKSTLQDRVKKARTARGQNAFSDSGNESSDEDSLPSIGLSKYATRQVFSVPEENELESYLKQSSQILYGLTYQATRKLAYHQLN